MVYLLHFGRKHFHAGHYIGSSDDPEKRLQEHIAGNGARLMEVITEQGIKAEIVRTWEGGRKLERRLKNLKNAPDLCPKCNPKTWKTNGIFKE